MVKKIAVGFLAIALVSCSGGDSQMTQDEIKSTKADTQPTEASVVSLKKDKVPEEGKNSVENTAQGDVKKVNADQFKELVFNWEENTEWKFEGDKPCVVDFYADWCGPCKMVAPRLEALAQEYEGQVNFYKVNTDEQKALSGVFGIRGIPSILFCPKEGQPQMSTGAFSKEDYKKMIEQILFNKTSE